MTYLTDILFFGDLSTFIHGFASYFSSNKPPIFLTSLILIVLFDNLEGLANPKRERAKGD